MPMRAVQPYREAPAIPDGLIWTDPDAWSVIVPEATTNLVTNPTPYSATTGYTAFTATMARSTAFTRRSVASLSLTPAAGGAAGQGCYYATSTLVSGTTYTFSLDLLGPAGVKYALQVTTTANVRLSGQQEFTATGFWQRLSITYTETASAARRLFLQTAQTTSRVFYTDGWQLEALAYPTTYTDGAQADVITQTPAAYLWTGTAYASTSTRSAQTRAGGRIVKLRTYGFTVLALIGLGMAGANVIGTPYGLIDGGLYQRTIYPPRAFTMAGRFDAGTPRQLERNRSAMLTALSRDLTRLPQPVVLCYAPSDCGVPTQEEVRITAAYLSGLEGEFASPFSEAVTVRFVAYNPYVTEDGVEAASLSAANLLGLVVERNATTGAWAGYGADISGGFALAFATAADGSIYVGGDFTAAGGVANTDGIAKWDGTTWTALGTGISAGTNRVRALAVGPDGTLYAGGDFSLMGGVANTVGIAKWDGSVWTPMGTGVSAGTVRVNAIIVGTNGYIFAGGDFTGMGGVANTDGIAVWVAGTTWVGAGTGISTGTNSVDSLVFMRDGTVVAGGDFSTMGGVADTLRIARYTYATNTWSALSTGANGNVAALAVSPTGVLYAGGAFTSIGGITTSYLAQWNGSTWAAVGSTIGSAVVALSMGIDGILYIVPSVAFTTASDTTAFVLWNGSSLLPGDVNSVPLNTIYMRPNGSLIVAIGSSTGLLTGGVTTITNSGTALSAATFIIVGGTGAGASSFLQVKNVTTGQTIWAPIAVAQNEVIRMVIAPGAVTVTSNIRFGLLSNIMPGSNLAQFAIVPGVNIIEAYYNPTAGASITLQWTPQYMSLDDVTP